MKHHVPTSTIGLESCSFFFKYLPSAFSSTEVGDHLSYLVAIPLALTNLNLRIRVPNRNLYKCRQTLFLFVV